MRIAMIEDSPGDRAWFTLILKETGMPYKLSVYGTGVEALKRLPTDPAPDVIVCDWFFPMLRFPEFVTKLREIPGLIDVPIAVFVMFEEHEAIARQLGVAAVLTKPIDAAQMYRLLQVGAARRGKGATQV